MPTLDELQAQIAALDAKVERAIKGIALLVNHLGAAPRANGNGGQSAAAPTIATDAELDSQYGDPEVRQDPKRWQGASFAGRRMSTCSPAYLDELASFCDWKAERDEATAAQAKEDAQEARGRSDSAAEEAAKKTAADKAKWAKYARSDAAKARGWARRLRERPARCDGAHGGAPCTDPGCYTRPPQEEV